MITTEELYQHFKEIQKISTDTREDVTGSIFFSLSGENFDGNQFAELAIQKGALFAVIDNKNNKKDNRFLLVNNTLIALQELASYHRDFFNIPIIAITGSNGKTTTKELIGAVLGQSYKISLTEGNFNNHIGVPLTLLKINERTEMAVVEIGANHRGEIEHLCSLAKPSAGIITNVGKAHIEGFGSIEGVIQAKSELYKYIHSIHGELIVNADDQLLMKLSEGIKRFTYGSKKADVTAQIKSTLPTISFEWKTGGSSFICKSNLYGKYNLSNMLAAIAFGIRFGVPAHKINLAIESYIPENSRSQLLKSDQNTIILDAYNANPVSMTEAIKSFAEFKGENPWLIIGDMFELGPIAVEEHKKIIELLNSEHFSNVLLVGKEFFRLRNSNNFLCFETTEEVKKHLEKDRIEKATILIKGSRGMKLEKLLGFL